MTISSETIEEGLALLSSRKDDPRAQVLLAAASCVLKNRNRSYGEPEDNFARIAGHWNAWKPETSFDSTDVAIMSAGIKLGRLMETKDHVDSYVDAIGYLACGYRLVALEKLNG